MATDLTTEDMTGIGRACRMFGVAGPNNNPTILAVAELIRQQDQFAHAKRRATEEGCELTADTLGNVWVRNTRAEAAERKLRENAGDETLKAENAILRAKLAALEEIRRDKNIPVRYFTVGSVIYAVWGSSSIDYVEQLRDAALNACSNDEPERLRTALIALGRACGSV